MRVRPVAGRRTDERGRRLDAKRSTGAPAKAPPPFVSAMRIVGGRGWNGGRASGGVRRLPASARGRRPRAEKNASAGLSVPAARTRARTRTMDDGSRAASAALGYSPWRCFGRADVRQPRRLHLHWCTGREIARVAALGRMRRAHSADNPTRLCAILAGFRSTLRLSYKIL